VVGNVLLKFALAVAVLALSVAASGTKSVAAPRNNDCVDCAPPSRYDSEEVVRKIRNIDHSSVIETKTVVPAGRRIHEAKRAYRPRYDDCGDCAPRRKYDSQEVVKKVRNVDHSRVINTRTVVPVRTRVKETNHLVIHKNEIRNVGVVQHNRIVVEKEIRYVQRIPVHTTVEFVTRNYRVVERPDSVSIPVTPYRQKSCHRGRSYGGDGSCRSVLRVRG
jgi:hypothetical protein